MASTTSSAGPPTCTDDASADRLVESSEAVLDGYAPGWRDLVLDRWVQRPSDLATADANLVGGAVTASTRSTSAASAVSVLGDSRSTNRRPTCGRRALRR